MKAIVLTYDERATFADLTISSYMQSWKKCPLQFVVPYNNEKPYYKDKFENIEFVKTDKSVKNTMCSLLQPINDNEFVYWCLDDIYLHEIKNQHLLNFIFNIANKKNTFDVLRLRNPPRRLRWENVVIKNKHFYRTGFGHSQFWFHYFVRAKVLKKIFFSDIIKPNATIGKIGIERRKILTPNYSVLYPQRDVVIFGESTRRGTNTLNCKEALEKYNIKHNITKFSRIRIFNNFIRRV